MIKAELIDHMGSDLTVANAARVSFDKESKWDTFEQHEKPTDRPVHPLGGTMWKALSLRDQGLIRFLARGCESGKWEENLEELQERCWDEGYAESILKWAKNLPSHWTPFAHTAITLREHVPIPIARQRFKHKIGLVENEVSRRYVTAEPEFFMPDKWRAAAENVKQGSSEDSVESFVFHYQDGSFAWCEPSELVSLHYEDSLHLYNEMIRGGICPEQARMVLPQGMMTTYWVTGSLYAFAQAYIARSDPHAQKEIRDLAAHWDRIIRPLFPVSWAALVD